VRRSDLLRKIRLVLARHLLSFTCSQTLMAPRAARILISEYLAPSLSQSAGPSTTTSGSTRAKFARRMSGAVGGGGGKKGSVSGKGTEWLVCFTDVVVRAIKTGETSCVLLSLFVSTWLRPLKPQLMPLSSVCRIPGSFSREKEKRGKQGAPCKVGKTRNTCASSSPSFGSRRLVPA